MLRRRKFQAYKIADDWWVTIERVAVGGAPWERYRWTLRTLQFITVDGAVVPSRDAIAVGYSPSRRQARGEAYRAALNAARS